MELKVNSHKYGAEIEINGIKIDILTNEDMRGEATISLEKETYSAIPLDNGGKVHGSFWEAAAPMIKISRASNYDDGKPK